MLGQHCRRRPITKLTWCAAFAAWTTVKSGAAPGCPEVNIPGGLCDTHNNMSAHGSSSILGKAMNREALFQWRTSVSDAGPSLKQRLANVSFWWLRPPDADCYVILALLNQWNTCGGAMKKQIHPDKGVSHSSMCPCLRDGLISERHALKCLKNGLQKSYRNSISIGYVESAQ